MDKHSCVCFLLKEIFNKRAPVPRYTFIWDVKVLTYHSTLGMPEHLNDKILTLKTTMLLALTFSTRAHYIFHFSKITKTAKEGKLRPPVQLTQLSDKSLCACHYIDVYLERTKAW